ncbi:hypothetical protein D3C86_1718110 [compost metagenome]
MQLNALVNIAYADPAELRMRLIQGGFHLLNHLDAHSYPIILHHNMQIATDFFSLQLDEKREPIAMNNAVFHGRLQGEFQHFTVKQLFWNVRSKCNLIMIPNFLQGKVDL